MKQYLEQYIQEQEQNMDLCQVFRHIFLDNL